jgi:hypothetical protein
MRSRQCERYSGVGAVSSVGERFLDTEEVISSILIPPTMKNSIKMGVFDSTLLGAPARCPATTA